MHSFLHIIDECCNQCGSCVSACAAGALGLGDTAVVLTQPEACGGCGDCEDVCPEDAIYCDFEVVGADDNGDEQSPSRED